MSRSAFNTLDTILWGPAALFLNGYFDTVIKEYPLLYVCLVRLFRFLCSWSVSKCAFGCRSTDWWTFSATAGWRVDKSATASISSVSVSRILRQRSNRHNNRRQLRTWKLAPNWTMPWTVQLYQIGRTKDQENSQRKRGEISIFQVPISGVIFLVQLRRWYWLIDWGESRTPCAFHWRY